MSGGEKGKLAEVERGIAGLRAESRTICRASLNPKTKAAR
jgi:hypothetical protein